MIAGKSLIVPVGAALVVAGATWSVWWQGSLQPAQAAMQEGGAVAEHEEVVASAGAQQAPTSPLEELAVRLLTPAYSMPAGETPTVKLLPGQLPPDLPLTLAIPDGGRLIGSVVRSPAGKFGATEIVMDAPGRAADAFAFYRKALEAQGWTEQTNGRGPVWPRAGFQASSNPTNGYFCKSALGPFMGVNVFPRGAEPNDVRLQLQTAQAGPCGGPMQPPPGKVVPEAAKHLPALEGSEEMQLQVNYNGGGRWVSEATAETSMSAKELESHFASQLQVAGWTRRAGNVEGALAWSIWDAPGTGGWQGFFYALEGPDRDQRTLYVRVESAGASQQQLKAAP